MNGNDESNGQQRGPASRRQKRNKKRSIQGADVTSPPESSDRREDVAREFGAMSIDHNPRETHSDAVEGQTPSESNASSEEAVPDKNGQAAVQTVGSSGANQNGSTSTPAQKKGPGKRKTPQTSGKKGDKGKRNQNGQNRETQSADGTKVSTSGPSTIQNGSLSSAFKEEMDKDEAKSNKRDMTKELEQATGIKLTTTQNVALCLRPAFPSGQMGNRIPVLTNFFKLDLTANANAWQYEVVFLKADESAPVAQEDEIGRKFKRLTKRMNQRLLATFVQTTGSSLFEGANYAYDNDRILITSQPLHSILPESDESIFSFQFTESESEKPITETIFIRIRHTQVWPLVMDKQVNKRNLGDYNRPILHMLDIIVKAHAFKHDTIYGSKIFTAGIERNEMKIGNRPTPYEMAFGYHQSTQYCQDGLMQNIDRATTVLYKGGPLIKTMSELLGIRIDQNTKIDARSHEMLKELTYIRVETNYRGFTSRHTIRSFSSTPANKTFFNDADGKMESVADYFNSHYKLQCKYPNLPCIEYSQGKYIPVEQCTVLPDQRNQKKLRDDLIRIVSYHTTTQKPADRSARLAEVAKQLHHQLAANKFGLSLTSDPVQVDSRIFPAPSIDYQNRMNFTPFQGGWEMKNHKMLRANALERWGCICLTRKLTHQVVNKFLSLLMQSAHGLGMRMSEPSFLLQELSHNFESKFRELKATKNPQLIIVMMTEDTDRYARIKSFGDRVLGVPTQVILDKHYDTNKPRDNNRLFDHTFLSNVLLKINIKNGGTNLRLNMKHRNTILNEKTMVVGIDVNHPSPGESAPSIAAVVGSIDAEFSQYRTEIQINDSREEIVAIDRMIVPLLNEFKSQRGFYPRNIIVYRDGVSEGQFLEVMSREILPLHKKLECSTENIQLTYIVVQKRHNARFFPFDFKHATRSGNILPGSVIDTKVCHYKWFDFYLCSQNSFLGTARPGKYTVLWNSSGAQADDLQMATYYLCYLFARATKAISDPAPARYAHHAAARGKVYLKEKLKERRSGLDDEAFKRALSGELNIVDDLKKILYFI